jgi:DNA-binding LacI/PurR family transcriptional regulator
VTLGDIARRSGVHPSTVSAVLAGKSKERRISPDVAARVEAAAAEMDYAPNLVAHSLQRGRTHVLSFFNGYRSRDRRDFYMDALNTAIERAGGALGYDILVYCDFRRKDVETYRTLNGGRSDGLLFFAPQDDDPLLRHLIRSRLPAVLVGGTEEADALSSVTADWRAGMSRVAQSLVALGHRRVAALTANGPHPDAHRRVAFLRERLAAAGAAIPDRWVLPADAKAPAEGGAALRFLRAEPEPPTALFCWHDYVGYVILEQCEAQGISVPGALSVVGFDGLRWPAKTQHTLASVAVDLDAMGEAAVEMLNRLIGRRDAGPIRRVLPVTFDEGTTLGPAHE